MSDDLQCDLLLFFTTTTEKEQLREVAAANDVVFERRQNTLRGRYYYLGVIGDYRVNAVQTTMGPLDFEGSASKGIYYKSETGATAIVQLGMAFGCIPKPQQIGDVLVSKSIIPYDRRDIRQEGDDYLVDYSPAVRRNASASLVNLLTAEKERTDHSHQVYVGALLSGSTRIHSEQFRDELLSRIPPGDDIIVGGEMEGIGLLSISPPEDPAWVIVKGICDFADRPASDEARTVACRNSAQFVIAALLNVKRN